MSYTERRQVTDLLNQRDRERRTTREDRIGFLHPLFASSNDLNSADELADADVHDDGAGRQGVFRTHYGTVGDDRDMEDDDDEQEVEYREMEVNLEVSLSPKSYLCVDDLCVLGF
jgi:hypothetical protein